MTTFETILADLGSALGTDLSPDSDGIAQIAAEDRIVLLRPEDNGESATFFSSIATLPDDKDGAPARRLLENALSLNLFGRDTLGGHLGLFVDTIFLSRNIPLAGLSAEDLGDRLIAFSRLATELTGKLETEPPAASDGDSFLPDSFRASLLRI